MTANILKLPFEIYLEIFQHIPIASFHTLYSIFPQSLIDQALVFNLYINKSTPLLRLVSTNLHELSTHLPSSINSANESSLYLYYSSFDHERRSIWTLPSFGSFQHYFKVKDSYVSHGKLVLCHPSQSAQKHLASLWDIKKALPPQRAGSFSGASEYTTGILQDFSVHQSGCVLDSCLIPVSHHLSLNCPKQIPLDSTHSSTCGYLFVESLAISIPTFLELFLTIPPK